MTNDKKEINKKSYFSIVPAEVRYCRDLGNASPRDLYGEVSALCNEKGFCWATNKYFADLYETTSRTIQRWLKLLEDNNFIYIDNSGPRRKIFLAQAFRFQNGNQPEAEEEIEEKKPKKKKKVSKKKKTTVAKVKFSKEDLELAELLYSKIIFNYDSFKNKKVNIEDWADDIRKLRTIDKASYEQIYFMIFFIHGGEIKKDGRLVKSFEPDDFWSGNILSAAKLRKQWFDHLVPKLEKTFKKAVKKNSVAKL